VTPAAADRRRRLRALAGPGGVIAGLAIDHRDSLGAVLASRGLGDLTGDDIRVLKLRLVRALAPAATAVMLDEEFGGVALDAGAVPPSVGLIMPLEAQGYEALGDGRTTTLLDDFSPADALRRGADACKILLPYRADHEPSATAQDELVSATVAACHDIGLPLVVEPVAYRWSNETPQAFSDAYRPLVVGAVRRLAPLGADLLKLPFPVFDLSSDGPAAAADACRELARACGQTPWVLLGAGADGETFIEQIGIAGAAGASGFLAGRGIWGVALDPDPDRAERLAATIARPLFERCRAIAEDTARPLPADEAG
jgi:tagatose-1,6-bisphosphate aldolase